MLALRCVARRFTLQVLRRNPAAVGPEAKFLGHGWCMSVSKSASTITPTDDPVVRHSSRGAER